MDLLLTLHGGTVFVAFLIICPTLFNQASSCKMEPVLFVGLCQANLRDLGLILSWEVTNTTCLQYKKIPAESESGAGAFAQIFQQPIKI